jgi:hypothetical protein
MRWIWLCLSTLVPMIVVGCDTIPDTLTASGPATQYPTSALPPNQVSLFQVAYRTAWAKALKVASGEHSTTADAAAAQAAYAEMAVEGFGLVRANCSDFFKSRGENQRWINVARDTAAAGGTAATGILALTGAGTLALSIVALSSATIYAGLDIYTKNFLFGAENIDAVRTLITAALDMHSGKVLADASPWTFQNAAGAILDNQEICKPASILALVKEAIKAGSAKVVASPGSGDAAAQADTANEQLIQSSAGLPATTPVTFPYIVGICWASGFGPGGYRPGVDDGWLRALLPSPTPFKADFWKTGAWQGQGVAGVCARLSPGVQATIYQQILADKAAAPPAGGQGPGPAMAPAMAPAFAPAETGRAAGAPGVVAPLGTGSKHFNVFVR